MDRLILKGRQLGLRTISKRFKMFWDIRKPYWKGSDIELVDDIFNDPDFIEGLHFKHRGRNLCQILDKKGAR